MRIITFLLLANILMFGVRDKVIAQSSANGNDTAQPNIIPWKPIKDADILWKKRVWRQIEIYEKANAPFRNDPAIPAEYRFANILLNRIKNGTLKAYANGDTSFTKPLTIAQVDSALVCNPADLSIYSRMYIHHIEQHTGEPFLPFLETSKKHKRLHDILVYDTTAINICTYPQQIEFYSIVEDWIFDKSAGQMVVRIVAIAPTAMVNGKHKPLFWLPYLDIRPVLAQFEAYSADKKTARYNWDEFFELRQFSSKITKVSGDNKNVVERHKSGWME